MSWAGLPESFDVVNLPLGQIPKFQPPPRSFQQRCARRGDFRKRTFGQRVASPQRQQVFLFRSQQVRAVKREQRIALLHLLPGVIDENLFDPTTGSHVDVYQARLVHRHLAHGADGLVERSVFSLGRRDSHQLLARGTDLHTPGWERRGRRLGGIDRNELHPVRREPGFVRVMRGVHGILVIENLAFPGLRLIRRLGGINRHQLHAAVRRDPRLVGVIPGVHGVLVIENLSLAGICLAPQPPPSVRAREMRRRGYARNGWGPLPSKGAAVKCHQSGDNGKAFTHGEHLLAGSNSIRSLLRGAPAPFHDSKPGGGNRVQRR